MHAIRTAFMSLALAGITAGPVLAEDSLARPEGAPVLTVTGDIALTNTGGAAVFDMAMLRELPAETFTTTTIWTEGEQEFTGVPIAALLELLGVEGGTLKATAINDYSVELPVGDESTSVALLAYERNGQEMSVRDKGPLWVVYPFDSDEALQSEVIYSRSIWQLDRIEAAR